jgi:hypothetical protein
VVQGPIFHLVTILHIQYKSQAIVVFCRSQKASGKFPTKWRCCSSGLWRTVVCFSETLVSTHESTRRHNPEEQLRHHHRRENLKSYIPTKWCSPHLTNIQNHFWFTVFSGYATSALPLPPVRWTYTPASTEIRNQLIQVIYRRISSVPDQK